MTTTKKKPAKSQPLPAEALAQFLRDAQTLTGEKALRRAISTARKAVAAVERENKKLRDLASCAYLAMGVFKDTPERWLDALGDAACGRKFSTQRLLPFTPTPYVWAYEHPTIPHKMLVASSQLPKATLDGWKEIPLYR